LKAELIRAYVPKSEVDLYRKQVDELEDELASTYDKLENAKAEVAREIFEEIEKELFDAKIDFYEKFKLNASLGYDKEKYEYAKSMIMNLKIQKEKLAELKKKYTEDQSDG
jgi:hypothetical protein